MIAYSQNRVHRFRFAEHSRRTRVLDARDDRRGLAYKSRSVTAERHCAQVVFLLHGVFLSVETERGDPTILNHGFVTRCFLIERVGSIERAEVHPHLIALGRELVLELNMVEILLVEVKISYFNRQIISRRVARREGIHYPVSTRSHDRNRT